METATPMMAQYYQIKKEFPHALVFFRLGDFYEMFFEDALVASRELEITLTSRNKEKGLSVPMCGVPYHAADNYIAKLIRKGFKVAICDQVENPKHAQKLVRREVTRVVTPGTVSDGNLLEPHENNFLSAVWQAPSGIGLAAIDLSTGDFRATEFQGSSAPELLRTELERLQPKEVIYPSTLNTCIQSWRENVPFVKTPVEEWTFAADYAQRLLSGQFGVMTLDGLGCQNKPLAVAAAGSILHYLKDTQKASLNHIAQLKIYDLTESLILDQSTVRNLELVESLFDGSRHATLIACLDKTSTGMGARLLKSWLLRPEIDLMEISCRLDAVTELKERLIQREGIKSLLKQVYDIERLLSKVSLSTATARDLISLKISLEQVPDIKSQLQKFSSQRLQCLHEQCDSLEDVTDLIRKALKDNPPVLLTEGG